MTKISAKGLWLVAGWWFVTWQSAGVGFERSGPWTNEMCEFMRLTAVQDDSYVGRCIDGPPPTEKDVVGGWYTYRSRRDVYDDENRLRYANGEPVWFAGALERSLPVTVFPGRDDLGPQMKLTKALVGKQVRVRWRDQRSLKVVSSHSDRHDVARGRKTLATWEEWGVVDSVEEGVLHLLQGIASDPPHETDREDQLTYSVVPEESIESLTILEDKPEAPA